MKCGRNIVFGVLVVFLFFTQVNAGVNESVQKLLDDEATYYIQALTGSEGEALFKVALELQDTGISDARILDTAEKVAIEQHKIFNSDSKRKYAHNAAASLARALAGSGTNKYHPTLVLFVKESRSRRLRNLSNTLVTRMAWYRSRNTIANNFSNHDLSHPLQVTRWMNMLNATDPAYGRYAAESMTRIGRSDAPLMARMAEILKENYKNPGSASHLDALAWYARFLGRSGGDDYRPLLLEVSSYKTLDKKLVKHLKKALKER